MNKVHVVKITAYATQYVAIPARNEVDAINKAHFLFKETDEIDFSKNEIDETHYQVAEVLDNELSQAFELMTERYRKSREDD